MANDWRNTATERSDIVKGARDRERNRGGAPKSKNSRQKERARAGPPDRAIEAKTELAALANALQVRCIRGVSHCIGCIR